MPPPSKSALERHPGTIHMFIGQFFKQNPNFGVKRLLKAISRVQVNNENGNQRDQDGVAHFFKYTYDTCLYANFSMGIQISGSQG